MGHFGIVGILVILMTVLTYFGLDAAGLAKQMHPVAASAQAASIDQLWHWEMMVISFLFSLIVVPMVYSLAVFRQKKGELKDGEHIEGNTQLEITWTVIPLFTVIAFAYFGAYSLGEVRRVDPDAFVVNVQARQFSWTFEYPEYGVVSTELHLPVGRQVVLKMESADVIHSFWVPEFRVKQDVVPGRVTEYRITPTKEGSYKVRCAELCGVSHAYMENKVIVDSQAQYEAWVAEQVKLAAEAQTPEGQGKLLATKNACVGCHSADGTAMTGPTWFNLYGSQVSLADGSTVTADEAFLTESIRDPNASIVATFASPSVMPPYPQLTDEEIANIIAYIKTLK
ncbi:MAG: cytochrome c oxidase subunit II [Chloroflexi bacterium]|nr:cytochrome c oxidase subunit 2 [Anaerolineales bacterium]MCE7918520.1 cytochrome c oxidase subunit II [Chloroflexi bacterium CFX1]MCQ3953595.1 cytochrome c oxidase subunit II [Chloroflexota bacterium]MDL1918377.1 cytochrome c oxidase subunit II [Chloroflexi bacterium CFX5]MCK6567977.1 cytochrome c oxidase subunit II [Anaerolineales bacterium]